MQSSKYVDPVVLQASVVTPNYGTDPYSATQALMPFNYPNPSGIDYISKYGGDHSDCCSDPEACLWLCFALPCAVGKVAAAAQDEDCCSGTGCIWCCFAGFFGCGPCAGGLARMDLEAKLTPQGHPRQSRDFCHNCCIQHYCCICCSITQEIQAVKAYERLNGVYYGGPSITEMER